MAGGQSRSERGAGRNRVVQRAIAIPLASAIANRLRFPILSWAQANCARGQVGWLNILATPDKTGLAVEHGVAVEVASR